MVTCCIKTCLSVFLRVKVDLTRIFIIKKKTTHNFTLLTQILTNMSGSIEEIAGIDSLWLADAWCKNEVHFLVFGLQVFWQRLLVVQLCCHH